MKLIYGDIIKIKIVIGLKNVNVHLRPYYEMM